MLQETCAPLAGQRKGSKNKTGSKDKSHTAFQKEDNVFSWGKSKCSKGIKSRKKRKHGKIRKHRGTWHTQGSVQKAEIVGTTEGE